MFDVMKFLRFSRVSALALLAVLMVFGAAQSWAAPETHPNQIWGALQTQDRSTANVFKNFAVCVSKYNKHRLEPVIAYSKFYGRSEVLGLGADRIPGDIYSINMRNLPAGKYVVQLIPIHGSEYQPGEVVVNYAGAGSSVRQDWTVNLTHGAAPSLE
jgi:hypothetical protein